MIRFRQALVPCVALLAACAVASPRTTTSAPDASVQSVSMVSDRLFFGRNIPDGGTVSDSAWTAFLAEVVTPRFPSGLTVFSAQGQWTDPQGKLVRENAMVVELDHPPGAASDSLIAAIAEDYRRRFRQDAVLRITAPVQMRLYTGARR